MKTWLWALSGRLSYSTGSFVTRGRLTPFIGMGFYVVTLLNNRNLYQGAIYSHDQRMQTLDN